MRVASLVLLLIVGACSGGDSSPPACTNGGLNCQCVTNADCGSTGEFRCNNLLCKPLRSATIGATCWATPDCMDGSFCTTAGRCAAVGTGPLGTACTSDADCTQDLRCNIIGLGARCAPAGTSDLAGLCSKQTDCVGGLFCGGGTCKIFPEAFPAVGNTGDNCANEGAFRAYFEVPRPSQPPADFYRLPFPNDIRLVGGKPDMSDFYRPSAAPFGIDLTKIYLDAQAADFDRYSPVAAVTLRFSQNIDFNTLASATKLFDLTAGGEVANTYAFTPQRTKWSCENRLSVQPLPNQPMVGDHTYAVVITNAVRSAGGTTPVQDPDLAAVLGATRPTDASLGAAWDVYTPLRARLGAEVANVATAAVFTVADVRVHMNKVAAAVSNEGNPTLSALTLCSTGGSSACGACGADDPAFTEVHGKISMPIFQQGTAPYLTAGGDIMETGSAAVKVRDEDVCFALTIPKGSAMPGAGWPLVVFAHGTGGTFRDFITNGVAASVAGAGGATFSFEAVGHGMRRGGSSTDPADIVYNVLNPRAARDVWLQGAADVLTALKVAQLTVNVPSGPTADFDPSKLVFFGHSQGATSGELALPFTTSVSAVILSGAGANLGEALAAKTKPFNIPRTLLSVLGDSIDALHPVAILLQSYFDRSDPLATAPSISGKHIYMSWGTTDSFSPLATLEYNALALKLRPVSPVLEQIDTASNSLGAPISRPVAVPAVFQYDSGGEGHFVAFQVAAAKTDWLAFITSYWATGSTIIP